MMWLSGDKRAPVLMVAVVLSALAVVRVSHECRSDYAQLQSLESVRWALQENYSRLVLEESTLGSPHRIMQVASGDLAMAVPSIDRIQVVSQ
tara:strand:+ start:399 stop:674 length:276 start_codon:yes stop_codon:yes gene_type:complete